MLAERPFFGSVSALRSPSDTCDAGAMISERNATLGGCQRNAKFGKRLVGYSRAKRCAAPSETLFVAINVPADRLLRSYAEGRVGTTNTGCFSFFLYLPLAA